MHILQFKVHAQTALSTPVAETMQFSVPSDNMSQLTSSDTALNSVYRNSNSTEYSYVSSRLTKYDHQRQNSLNANTHIT